MGGRKTLRHRQAVVGRWGGGAGARQLLAKVCPFQHVHVGSGLIIDNTSLVAQFLIAKVSNLDSVLCIQVLSKRDA